MPSSSELLTRVARDAGAHEAEDRALQALRAFEAERRATHIACRAAVVEAKRCYFATARPAAGPVDPLFAASIHDCHNVDQVVALLLEQDGRHAGSGEPFRTPSIAWWTRLLRRRYRCDVDTLPDDVGESLFAPSAHCRRAGARLVSAPFLARLAWLRRLAQVLPLPEARFTVLEMGGGFGALSRLVKLTHPQARLVLLDTPEALFHQQAFLRASFPELRHRYLLGPGDELGDADVAYVPHAFADALAREEIFVAVHAESPVSGRSASTWLDIAQHRTQAEHLFFLAPFLNRIGRDALPEADGACDWSFRLDGRWRVRDWEVDPEHERCPFFQTTQPRRLQLVASRDARPGDGAEVSASDLETLRLEDWSLRPGDLDGCIVTGAAYPPPRSRGDLDLTPDLSRDGTLHALWNRARLVGDGDALTMLIGYLDVLNGQRGDVFFEEIPMLVARHAALARRGT